MAKSKKRLILKIFLGILLTLVILFVVLLLFINPIAKTAIVKGVPMVLGDDITASVEDFDLSIFKGRLEIKDLVIGNPEGYSKEHAFNLGHIVADLEPGSIMKDKIHIEHLRLADIDVVFEKGLVTRSNLDEILSRLEKKEKEEEEEKEEKKEKAEKTFQFDKIEIENVGVTLVIAGVEQRIAVSIDPMENLGVEEGITATDLAYDILGAIIKKALALDAVQDALGAVGTAVSETASSIGTAVSETAATTVDSVVDAGKGLVNGIFGGGDKKKEEDANAGNGN